MEPKAICKLCHFTRVVKFSWHSTTVRMVKVTAVTGSLVSERRTLTHTQYPTQIILDNLETILKLITTFPFLHLDLSGTAATNYTLLTMFGFTESPAPRMPSRQVRPAPDWPSLLVLPVVYSLVQGTPNIWSKFCHRLEAILQSLQS
jgi:hypothetical protein